MRPVSTGHRSLRSYTLIELLLVVALLGIAGTLLIPQIVGRDIMAAQAAVRLIIGDVSFAQADALSHQEFRRIHFNDPDGNGDINGYSISRVTEPQLALPFDPDTADYINDPLAKSGELGRYIVDLRSDNRFDSVVISSVDVDGGGRDLHFDALGGTVKSGNLPGTGGTIVVSSPSASYRITIAPFTGKMTVQQL